MAVVAFATVALQHPDLAAEQLEEGVRKLGLRGGSIGANVAGEELSDPKFHPFWAKAERLGCLIFIHPQGGTAGFEQRLRGSGGLGNVIGNPLDTTIALSHLIFEGTLDRFPGLKICAAHGGGYLPSYAARSDAGCVTFPDRCPKPLKKRPTEYLRQLYYDSIVFTPEALRHLVAEVGSGQIVMGTDYPFPWMKTSVDHILDTPGLSDAERAAMLGDTAERHAELVLVARRLDAILHVRHFLPKSVDARQPARGALHERVEVGTEQVEPRIGEPAEVARLQRGTGDDERAAESTLVAGLAVAVVGHVLRAGSAHVVLDVFVENRPGARGEMRHHVFADQAAPVGEALRVRAVRGIEQDARVLRRPGGEHHDARRLELPFILLVVVLDAGDASALGIGEHAGHRAPRAYLGSGLSRVAQISD